MSNSYHSQYESAQQRSLQSRPHPHSAAVSHQARHRSHDYTLLHHGRQVRVGPVAFWIFVGTLVVMGVWTLGTGTYFAFKENVLTRLVARQAEMQFAYEDRVQELRAQVDRIASRQLLDQEKFEQKLDALMKRQVTLEQRTSQLAGETGSAPRGKQAPSKPSPISDNGTILAPPERQSSWLPSFGRVAALGLEGTLGKIANSLDLVERKQSNALTTMEETADAKASRIRGVLSDLGADLGKAYSDFTGAIGGPYVPLKKPPASTFEQQMARVNVARGQLDRLNQSLVAVPIRKPVEGDIDMSSPFGSRMDPFLRGPAIHTGVDLRGDTGDPVHVTAAGTVVTASWQGGYGNMVEVDHNNGFSTRYGHLSKIEVKVGQRVRIGDVIGLIGSTGRSTGPHLHYETRVNDTAVDPTKFFKAAGKLGTFGDL